MMSVNWKAWIPAAASLGVFPLVVYAAVLTRDPMAWRSAPFAVPYHPVCWFIPLAVPAFLAAACLLVRQRAAAAVNGAAFLFAVFFVNALTLVRINYAGSSKGDLGAIRSALSIYYGDLEGVYPEGLGALTVDGKYISKIPPADTQGRHPKSARAAVYGSVRDARDTGGWGYVSDPRSEEYGILFIDCTHRDPKGTVWTVY